MLDLSVGADQDQLGNSTDAVTASRAAIRIDEIQEMERAHYAARAVQVSDVHARDFDAIDGGLAMQGIEDGQLVAADAATGAPKDQKDGLAVKGIQTILAAVGSLESEIGRLASDLVVAQEEEHGDSDGNPRQRA